MSCYQTDFIENERLAAWLSEQILDPLNGSEMRASNHHPTIEPASNVCRACSKRRCTEGGYPWNGNARCRLCFRFRITAPILRRSNWCSCPCDCYNADTEVDDTEDEDVMSVDMTEDEDDAESLVEADLPDSYRRELEMSEEELRHLRRGLTAWEVHDLERLGHPAEELLAQFPEIRTVHERCIPPIRSPDRQYAECSGCHRDRVEQVEEALTNENISLCHRCDLPLICADSEQEPRSLDEHEFCFCRCTCPRKGPPFLGDEPLWRPFQMRRKCTTPSPLTLRWLEDNGFCYRDLYAEEVRDAVRAGRQFPSYREVLTHSMSNFVTVTREQAMLTHLVATQDDTKFPNGVNRDFDTESSLPKVLDTAILKLDPNAFGEVTRRGYEELGPDFDHPEQYTPSETRHWRRLIMSLNLVHQYGRIYDPAPMLFTIWAIEFEDAFGLGDADGDSICSIDEENSGQRDVEAKLQCEAEQYGGGPDGFQKAIAEHRLRHIQRRLERVAWRGSYPLIDKDARTAAELEFKADQQGFGPPLDAGDRALWDQLWPVAEPCSDTESDVSDSDASTIVEDTLSSEQSLSHLQQQRPPTPELLPPIRQLPPIVQNAGVTNVASAMAQFRTSVSAAVNDNVVAEEQAPALDNAFQNFAARIRQAYSLPAAGWNRPQANRSEESEDGEGQDRSS